MHLTRVVEECLRLGLVHRLVRETGPSIYLTFLETAPVHVRRGPGRTLCDAWRFRTDLRFRTVDDAQLADCTACAFLYR